MEQVIDILRYSGQFIGIIVATIVLAYVVSWLFRRFLKKSSELMRADPTNYLFLRHALVGLIYVVGFSVAFYTLPGMRTLASSLLAGAGIVAVAVGFASQHALSNVVSGVFIVIFKPFRVNDRLGLQNGLQGVVEDIGLRHVVVRDFENRRILIPNSVISDEILTNADYGSENICKWLDLHLALETDVLQVREIVQRIASQHPLCVDIRSPEDMANGVPKVHVRLIAITEYALHIRGYAWTVNAANAFTLGCEVLESVKAEFEQAGISFPRPKRELWQGQTKTAVPNGTADNLD